MNTFKLNIKQLSNSAKKAAQKALKPIIVKAGQSGCKTCGN